MLYIANQHGQKKFFFRCIRGFREKKMLQIDIVEDLKDDMLFIKNWINPIFNSS